MASVETTSVVTIDLRESTTRDINALLASTDAPKALRITNPQGAHALACGLDADLEVTIEGHVGYYCAGMNKHATVTVDGNVGVGVAENMMSGTVRVNGDASQSAAATAHGGLLVITGNAAARCGISMKGVDIVVGGDIGHMSAFMGQAGRLVVCGNAGEALGDSLYEARIYVRGSVASLGADCIQKPMRAEHLAELTELLEAADFDADPAEFTRYGSARTLYNFHVDNASAY
ncbi:protein glxC [Mycobacterium sp.]|jgi:glutamate synthase domain-containing protein 3|uniref:protein glxC n=1 Tax=Mycobacterium sp. TaxID=1785 RepID=UPI002D44B4A1|nr:protein glxC [Mycobacterium sp.]HZA11160.1 protein glxC [Mycobacterium sp.]